MTRSTFVAALLVVGLYCSAAGAQIFSSGRPPLAMTNPIHWDSSGSQMQLGGACTGGPNFMMLMGQNDLSLTAYGADGRQFRVTDGYLVEQAAGIPDRYTCLATTWDRETVYGGFSQTLSGTTAPILRFDLHGAFDVAVTPAEIDAVTGGSSFPTGLSVTESGALYTLLNQGIQRTLVRIDPSAGEGARITPLMSDEDFQELVTVPEGYELLDWGHPLAAADDGRVWFRVRYTDGNINTGDACQLMKLEPDGDLVPLMPVEDYVDTLDAPFMRSYLPCHAVSSALLYDPVLDLLIGAGTAMWVFHPDKPQLNQELVGFDSLSLTADLYTDGEYIYSPQTVSDPGTCLGFIGAQGVRAYGSKMYMLYSLALFRDMLDLDADRLVEWEELLLGSDPEDWDTDNDGLGDLAEWVDGTDPRDRESHRNLPQAGGDYSMTSQYLRSASHLSQLNQGELLGYLSTLPDGTIGVAVASGGQSDEQGLLRFTDWDQPMEPMPAHTCQNRFSVDSRGNVYCVSTFFDPQPYFCPADGSACEPLLTEAEKGLLYEEEGPSHVLVTPAGTVYIAFQKGTLLRGTREGGFKVFYSARQDMEKAGIVAPGEGDWCLEQHCQCTCSVGPMTYDPVRGMVFFWARSNIQCGPGRNAPSPVLMGIRHDGSLVEVMGFDELLWAAAQYGGLSIVDMEPDMAGGLWVLTTGGIDQSLFRVDRNYISIPVEQFRIPNGVTNSYEFEGHFSNTSLAHAKDMAVTPDGRLFFTPMASYNQYPPSHWLSEIIPTSRRVRPGVMLVTNAYERSVGFSDPRGAGMDLYFRDPLAEPRFAAGNLKEIFIADPGVNTVWVIPLNEDGSLAAAPEVFAEGFEPGGLDVCEDGTLLVSDRSARRVRRYQADGTWEDALGEGVLESPRGIACEAGLGFIVADDGKGAVFHVDAQGNSERIASIPGVVHVGVDNGRSYVASTSLADNYPVHIDPDGHGGWTLRSFPEWSVDARSDLTPKRSGGVACDLEGDCYWMMMGPAGGDTQYPKDSRVRILRYRRDGTISTLHRYGIYGTDPLGSLQFVHQTGEPWPAAPGAGPSSPEPEVVEQVEEVRDTAGTVSAEPEQPCRERSGGCSAMADRAPVLPALLLLGLALVTLRRTRGSAFLVALALSLAACSSDGTTCRDGASANRDASSSDGAYLPEVIPQECMGKDLCPPGHEPVCKGDAAYRICRLDEDGCFIWSPPVECPAGVPCADGTCPLCEPNCHGMECGDDGCGGSCGTCAGSDTCCFGFCDGCQSSCSGRVCGDDGAGGSCGDCPEGLLCAMGQCVNAGSLDCMGYTECTADCVRWSDPCFEDCSAAATQAAVNSSTSIEACARIQCAECYEMPSPEGGDCLDACLVLRCLDSLAMCLDQQGSATCGEIFTCLQACDSPACEMECVQQPTLDGHIYFLSGLIDCLVSTCDLDTLPSQSDPCVEAAMGSECAEYAGLCGQ